MSVAINNEVMSQNVPFTANQILFIEWMATPRIDRTPPTQELFADKLGINRKTITRWKQLPGFDEVVRKRARELLSSDLPEIYGALRREAKKGSFQHIKLAFEMTGEYTEAGTSQDKPFFVAKIKEIKVEFPTDNDDSKVE